MSSTKRHGQVFHLPPSAISTENSGGRKQYDAESLCALGESIKKYGVLQPITVRRLENGYGLVAGERRLRAAIMAGLTRIPCILVDANDTDTTILALVENLHRQDLDFIQEAQALYQLINAHGLSQEDAARRVGRSQSAVANKLRILRLPSEALQIIRDAGLTERHARSLLRIEDNALRMRVLNQIVSEGLNVARSEELIDKLLAENGKPPKPVFIVRDVKIFLNSVAKGVSIMQKTGIPAEYGRNDTDTHIIVTVKIAKSM